MNKRLFLLGLFLFSGIVLMATPAVRAQPDDWVNRIVADHGSALSAATTASPSDRARPDDWADRMIAAGAAAPQPLDWIDRMVADRSVDLGAPSSPQSGGVKAALAGTVNTRD